MNSDYRLGGLVVVAGVVVGCLCWWTLWSGVAPRHATVNHKVRAVDETALVAGKKQNCLSLLDGLAKTSSGEVNLAAVALGLVVAEPVLEKWGAVLVSYSIREKHMLAYFSGAGHKALNLKPSLACTIASSLVIAKTAPLLAVYAS